MTRLGQGAYVGFGLGAHGTDMTNSDMQLFMVLLGDSDGLQLERDVIEFPDMLDEFEAAHDGLLKAGRRRITGTLTLRATYDGLQDLLRMVTGHAVSPSGSSPWTYAFSPASRVGGSHYVLANSYVLGIEVFRGQNVAGTVANSTFYQNCTIQQMQWNFNDDGSVTVALTIIGGGYTISAKTASPSYTSDYIIMPTGQANPNNLVELDGTAYPCFSADILLNTGLDFRHDLTAIGTLAVMPANKFQCSGNFEIEVPDDTFLNKLDDPEGSRFNAGTFHIYGGTSGSRQLIFTFDEIILNSPAEPRASSLGPVRMSMAWTARSSAVGTPSVDISVMNGESAYTLTP